MAGSPVKSFALETSDIVIATATASAEAQAKAAETPVSLRDATLARLRRQDAYFKSKELQLLTIMQTVRNALKSSSDLRPCGAMVLQGAGSATGNERGRSG